MTLRLVPLVLVCSLVSVLVLVRARFARCVTRLVRRCRVVVLLLTWDCSRATLVATWVTVVPCLVTAVRLVWVSVLTFDTPMVMLRRRVRVVLVRRCRVTILLSSPLCLVTCLLVSALVCLVWLSVLCSVPLRLVSVVVEGLVVTLGVWFDCKISRVSRMRIMILTMTTNRLSESRTGNWFLGY